MSYLERVQSCAVYHPDGYLPFLVDGEQVGQVRADFAVELERFDDVFRVSKGKIELADNLKSAESRTDAMAQVLAQLRKEDRVPGWRDELYPATTSFGTPSLFDMERAAVPLFGVRGYGVHINGIVTDGDTMSMWIGRRSMSKPTGPGKLDQMVAGGQPAGMSLRDNMVKECAEEAGVPGDLAAKAISVGVVSYITERDEGLRHDILYNFDLRLPGDFKPMNTDGEVSDFYFWPIEQVAKTIRDTDGFKFNSALVIIDFLVRHGLIDADDPDYTEIVSGLRL